MKPVFKIILASIVGLECLLSVILAVVIYTRIIRKNVLGSAIIVPLSKNNFIATSDGDLKYYYEPLPDSTSSAQPVFLDHVVTYKINSDTLNNMHDYAISKPSSTFRILALGDSYTFGQYVNTEDAWPTKLEEKLNIYNRCNGTKKYEVLNFGVPGYGVQYITHRYEKRGIKYTPDLIIWLESGTGFYRINEIIEPLVEKYMKSISPEDLRSYQKKGNYYPHWYMAQQEMNQSYSQDQLSKLVLTSWREFFQARGDIPVVITKFPNSVETETLKNWTKNRSNIFITELSNISKMKVTFPDAHPNAIGHNIIARDTYNYLLQAKLLPCDK